jgi:hypothetical protein
MKVDVEIKDFSGTIITINGVDYETLLTSYAGLKSNSILIWKFGNRDIVLNVRNIVDIIVNKSEGDS